MLQTSIPANVNNDAFKRTFDTNDRKFRDDLLSDEIWAHPNIQNVIEVPLLQSIIAHIADSAHANKVSPGGAGSIKPAGFFKSHRGLLWATGDYWKKWQQRAVELRDKLHWEKIEIHINTVLSTVPFYQPPFCNDVLEHAEQALLDDIVLYPLTLTRVAFSTHFARHPKQALTAFPAVLEALCRPENAREFEKMALSTSAAMTWVPHFHPTINAWNLGEQCQDTKMLTEMAEALPDGALFKAWHGIALTLDETRIHPLAQALYVNKHAPVYMAEIQDLPKHWRLAMDLASTGAQFKAMLLQGQNPQALDCTPLPEDAVS